MYSVPSICTCIYNGISVSCSMIFLLPDFLFSLLCFHSSPLHVYLSLVVVMSPQKCCDRPPSSSCCPCCPSHCTSSTYHCLVRTYVRTLCTCSEACNHMLPMYYICIHRFYVKYKCTKVRIIIHCNFKNTVEYTMIRIAKCINIGYTINRCFIV